MRARLDLSQEGRVIRMSKAILVMDMPNGCDGCPICQGIATDGDFVCSIRDKDGNEQGFYDGEYERPSYCPLRELPQKKEVLKREQYEFGGIGLAFTEGYNRCIDEILGGGE